MGEFVIPAEIVRKVHGALSLRLDAELEKLSFGGPANAETVVDLSRLLKRQPEASAHRDELVRMVQDEQDPVTGLIRNQPEWICWPKALAEVTSTLRVLGATLRYRVPELDALADTDTLVAWVKSRNWDHPWGGATGSGHMVAGALFSMSDLGMLKAGALDAVFDVIDGLRDDTFGVWTKGRFDPANPGWVQLGGAFYFAMIYDRFKRPLDRPEGACRMLMEMQRKNPVGSFNSIPDRTWPFGSTDHDTLYVLLRNSRLDAALRREVMPAVERYARYFVQQMGRDETFLIDYPIPKILSLLRPVFPDPADDVPYWDYEMYKWVL